MTWNSSKAPGTESRKNVPILSDFKSAVSDLNNFQEHNFVRGK